MLVLQPPAGSAPAVDPVPGTWQTKPDADGNFGHVWMETRGGGLCGKLIGVHDASDQSKASENVGRLIVWDVRPGGYGTYGDGKVLAADIRNTCNAKMDLSCEELKASDRVFGICLGQVRARVD